MLDIKNLILFIRTAFSLFVAKGAAMPAKEERMKAYNRLLTTVYKATPEQEQYLKERFNDLFVYVMDNYPELYSYLDGYSNQRLAILNAVYITFAGSFYGVRVEFKSDLEAGSISDLENMLLYAEAVKAPYKLLLECIEHHRETIKTMLELEAQK